MQPKRGVIHNRERARQINNFSGLLYGNITPTDIDGLIEYHNKGYILIETKLRETKIEFGQRLAFERMTDDLTKSGKLTVCIIACHDIDNPAQDIDVANTQVREYRWRGIWQTPKTPCTTKELVDYFINHYLASSCAKAQLRIKDK